MDDGLFDALPDSLGSGIVFGIFLAVLVGLWVLIRRTRDRHEDDIRRRHEEWEPPPEPEDPRQLPPSG